VQLPNTTFERRFPRIGGLMMLLVVAGLMACGGGGSPTATTDTKAVLDGAAKRLAAVKSVHFNVAIDGDAFIDTGRTIALRSASGDIVTPDQMQAKIKISLGTANIDVSLVTIGTEKYQTNPVTGQWGPAQAGFDYSPTVLFDKDRGLAPLLGQLREVEALPAEQVAGQDADHLRGKVDRAAIEPITSGAIDGDTVTVDLWIAKASSDLLKLVITEPQTPNKAKPAVWTLTFEKYDQPVTITKPQ